MAAVDPLYLNVAYVGSFGRLYKIGLNPFHLLGQIPAPGGMLNMLRLDAKRRVIVASRDVGDAVARFNLDNSSPPVESPPLGNGRVVFDVVIDPDRGTYYAGALGFRGWSVIEGSLDDMTVRRESLIPGAYGFFMEIDRAGRTLFLASFFTGEIVKVDTETLKEGGRVEAVRGVRNLAFDPKRRVLFASDYFGGRLLIFQPDTNTFLPPVEVGPIVRYPHPDPNWERLVVRTGAGVFEIDLDRMLDARGGVTGNVTP
ncbi:MAG: hypothetical protein M5R36_14205 [Deltaproteobacteria bacterium]|nr:hypothetical protein [Deltaproteobacteria bacterium]